MPPNRNRAAAAEAVARQAAINYVNARQLAELRQAAVIDPLTMKLAGRARFGGGFLSPPLLVGGRLVAEIAGPRRIVALETAPPA